MQWFSWNPAEDPRGKGNWDRIFATTPPEHTRVEDISFVWGYQSPGKDVAANHFATVAESEIELPARQWRLNTTSDDGVHVLIDGEERMSNWTHHRSHAQGGHGQSRSRHRFRVEPFEIDGYACLELRVARVP